MTHDAHTVGLVLLTRSLLLLWCLSSLTSLELTVTRGIFVGVHARGSVDAFDCEKICCACAFVCVCLSVCVSRGCGCMLAVMFPRTFL